MKNVQPPNDALTKILVQASDLQKNELPNKNYQITDAPIKKFKAYVDGIYSLFYSQRVVLWNGKLNTKSRIILTYPAEILSTHFYILYFKSTNCLNLRVNINIPVNEILLDVQSESGVGSFLWASNVGLEVMIPLNTQIDFQLLVVSKEQLLKHLKSNPVLVMEKLIIFGNSNVPLFHYSKAALSVATSVILNSKSLSYSQKRLDILDILVKYFSLNDGISNEKCTLLDFQNMLTIEQHISQLPAISKPNIPQLAQHFSYSQQRFSKLFRQLFGKTMAEYHCAIHMEYACWLLETQRLSVCEVSDQLDFKNSKMFSRRFKSHYFTTPKIYKLKAVEG